jgi:hypothetical protein
MHHLNLMQLYTLGGLSPYQILIALETNGEVNATDKSGKIDRRRLPSLRDVQNIVKGLQKSKQFHTNDSVAVEKLLEHLERTQPGTVLKYTPQIRNDEGEITQSLKIILSNPFSLRMLKTFGEDQVFMDAAYGMSTYGYPLLAIVVRDEFTSGVPVAFCISDNEDAETYKEFLTTVAEAAGMKFSNIMVDKSKAEIAACKQLEINHLLCIFHMLQDFEKFCKSTKSGIHGNTNRSKRLEVYKNLRKLQVSCIFILNF